jgi:hypothetical protein
MTSQTGSGEEIGQPIERRRSYRNKPQVACGWVGWTSPEGVFERRQALLRDISHGGGMIHCQETPPLHVPIVFQLEGNLLPFWFDVTVVEPIRLPGGGCLLRVAFEGGCPYELYMAAAFGIASETAPTPRKMVTVPPPIAPAPRERPRRGGYWHR